MKQKLQLEYITRHRPPYKLPILSAALLNLPPPPFPSPHTLSYLMRCTGIMSAIKNSKFKHLPRTNSQPLKCSLEVRQLLHDPIRHAWTREANPKPRVQLFSTRPASTKARPFRMMSEPLSSSMDYFRQTFSLSMSRSREPTSSTAVGTMTWPRIRSWQA